MKFIFLEKSYFDFAQYDDYYLTDNFDVGIF